MAVSTHSKVDPGTLGWVRNEIDETLKQARLALESFAENPTDKTRLRFCVTHLHQVVGTLLMVELDGAAMLARETEQLAEAVLNEEVEASATAFDALTRAIVTLPEYLARLQFGQPDVPLKHLPLINELRAARAAEPVSEEELFAPDLSVRPPAEARAKAELPEAGYRSLARQLRPAFQAALLAWLRDNANKRALDVIADRIEQLQAQSALGALEQLFWVAGGLVEALREDGLETSVERKKLFARLDQQFKKIIDGAEKTELRRFSETLVRSILWELTQAKSRGPKVTQILRAFDLEAPPAGAPAPAYELPAPEVLQSVGRVLGTEIEAAQDVLTTYFDPNQRDPATLESLIGMLHKMSGTLDMLAVPALKNLVDETVHVCRALLEGRVADPDACAMPLAEALLLLESGARDVQRPAEEWGRTIEEGIHRLRALHAPPGEAPPATDGLVVAEAELSETEFKQLLGAVAHEVSVNLGRIEEALEAFAADASKLPLIEEVPALLNQVQGAMQILGQVRAAELVEYTRRHVEDIRHGRLVADSTVMDGLAVCVGTIGAYMEGLHSHRRNIEGLIDAAIGEMEAVLAAPRGPRPGGRVAENMPENLEIWLADQGNEAAHSALCAQLESISRRAEAQGQERLARIAAETDNLLRLVTQDPGKLTPDVVETMRQSFATLASLAATPPPESVITVDTEAEAAPTVVPEEVDEEIMDIFIEDARDVLGNIRQELAVWREDKNNKEALAELRRGYHTLKGSGRMVGATEIAELAWAVENVLNRVREGKVAYSSAIIDLLERSEAVLSRLVDRLPGDNVPDADTAVLHERARELAQPGAAVRVERRAESPPPVYAPDLPKLDGTLLEIFTNEARGHLATLRQEIAACREAGGTCLVSDTLYRSNHTLAGNARSLGLSMMSEACAETEKLLYTLRGQNLPLNEGQLALLARLEASVTELVNLLNSGATSAGALSGRFAEITHSARDQSARLGEASYLDPLEAGAVHRPEREEAVAPEAEPSSAEAPPGEQGAWPRAARPKRARPEPAATADGVDPGLIEIFHDEAADILALIEEALTRWRSHPADRTAIHDLKRALHTLKGGARMADVPSIGDLSHTTESLLRQVEEGRISPAMELFDLLDEVHDRLVVMLDSHEEGRPLPDTQDLYEKLIAFAPGLSLPSASAAPGETPAAAGFAAPEDRTTGDGETYAVGAPVAPAAARAAVTLADVSDERREGAEEEDKTWPEKLERRGQIKVNTGLLSELANFAGEVSISRSRMEQQIYSFRDNLGELSRNVTRFRDQIRELEIQSESQILYRLEQEAADARRDSDFDPLEFDRYSRLQQLSRSLAESLHDLSTIQNSLGNFVGEAEAVLQHQARLNTELQEGLMRTRMVSFATQAARLRHIVRQTARELGKRAELNLAGAEVELDRNVLERMLGPFEHMIRNSLDHGIEPADVRRQRGKPAAGRITIGCVQEGSEIVIRFSDDGAGLNIETIRAKAIERELMPRDANLSDDELIQFILISGFSTAERLTQFSGRGVGMDVVHNEVKQLGGSMSVDTKRGAGTTFIIRLPLTLSLTQALMVHVGDQMFAVPLASVGNIIEFPIEKLNSIAVGKNSLLSWNEQVYPYMNLGSRLGVPSQTRNVRKVPVLLARTGTREIAIQVDGLGGTREAVIKSLGPQIAEIKGLAGATILGDGRVILILDVAGLWYRDDAIRMEHLPVRPEAATEPVRERPVVMVVDDSLTVRKVTGKHLQKRGLEVMVAKDGVDAVEQLRDKVPDVMLVDIEMPRMDGYELTARVRSEERLKHIPIIIITSRAGAKHRQKALDLGVDMYMSKPYQEEELFKNIDMLLTKGRAR
jgi:chemosensory pili system protein ChpA (sensor histidine kinase/response regulator)